MVTIQNTFTHNLQTTTKSQRSKLPGHNVTGKMCTACWISFSDITKNWSKNTGSICNQEEKSQLLSDAAPKQASEFISLTSIQTHTQASNRKAGGEKSCTKNPVCAPLSKHTPRATLALPSVLQMQCLTNLCVVRHFQALHFNTIDDDILWMFPSPEAEAQAAA